MPSLWMFSVLVAFVIKHCIAKKKTKHIYIDFPAADRCKIVQRPPLTVAQIIALEATVHDTARTSYDRIAAGFFLMLIFGRLRYSDGLQLVDLQLDSRDMGGKLTGFLEAQAERTKTSVTLERKVRFFPVAIPLESFSEPSWVPVWLEL